MEKKDSVLKIVVSTAFGFFFLVMAAVILSSGTSKVIEDPKDQQAAVKSYYEKVQALSVPANTAYAMAVKKAGAGDVKGAYQDFKGTTGQLVRYATSELFKLKAEAPEVPDKQLLHDWADNTWMSFSLRGDAINAFTQGVEESKNGKILEAKTLQDKADRWLEKANTNLGEISSKYQLK